MELNFTEDDENVKASLSVPERDIQEYISAVNDVLFDFWNYLNKNRKNMAQSIPIAPEYFDDKIATYHFPSPELRQVKGELSERFREAENDDEDMTEVYQAFADELDSFE